MALCRRFGISPATGYRWLKRVTKEGLERATARVGRPGGAQGRRRLCWQDQVLSLRERHPTWGPRKLLVLLRRQHRRAKLPSERTVCRLLLAAGRVPRRQQRCRPGPILPAGRGTKPRCSNQVWTIDFKGHFHTGDGALCRPLTVRDLFSRYLLLCEQVAEPSERAVRRALLPCFRRYGLPRVIRVDNGGPFAGVGALGLSSLSVWWLRLGIAVEFTRPGKPQDNGAHEQMHRVLKAETARPPQANLPAQARALKSFQRRYNEQRPHEALGQRTPAQVYRPGTRAYAPPAPCQYPQRWEVRRVSSGGYTKWLGRVRLIGRAFTHEQIGLKPTKDPTAQAGSRVVEVYLGPQLIGTLHSGDAAGLRPAQWKRASAPQPIPKVS